MSDRQVRLAGLDALAAFARELAATLGPGSVLALSGGLGAGKTTLVRALVAALHGDDPASSPTFTFWQTYAGEPPIHHLDLYRIDDPRELADLGLEDAFDDPEAIVLVEWPERAPGLLPAGTRYVRIDGAGEDAREVVLDA